MDSGVDETALNAAENPPISQREISAGPTFLFALAVGILVMGMSASRALVIRMTRCFSGSL